MEKKVTAQGPSDRKSYTVTLPKDWVKQEKIDKTKLVDLEVIGGKLVISSGKKLGKRVIINGDIYSEVFIKVLQGLYRAGVSEIKIVFNNSGVLKNIITIIERLLIGYDVIEQKSDYIIIKNITEESEEEFKNIFRRVFLLLIEISECKDCVQLKTLERSMKKLINFCQRMLIQKGHVEHVKVPFYYLALDRLEKIGDAYINLVDVKRDKHIVDANKLLRNSYELFYTFDSEKYAKSAKSSYDLKERIKLDNNLKLSKMYIYNITRLLNSLYGDIYTLNFDKVK